MNKNKKEEYKRLLRAIWFYLLPTSEMRIKYLKKKDVFKGVGDNFFFQPRKLPADPKYIRFHNNVSVAADVKFINHDVIYLVLRNLDGNNNQEHMGCIEVMDNVFIGAGSIILPDVRIGPNAIIAAGSVVTKDVLPNSVVGGNPAYVIGDFESIKNKRLEESLVIGSTPIRARTMERAIYEWEKFYNKRER